MFREQENRYKPLTWIELILTTTLFFGFSIYFLLNGFSWLKITAPILIYIGILIRHKHVLNRLNCEKRTGFEMLFLVIGALLFCIY